MDADTASAAELAWENEGGRLRPSTAADDTGTPQRPAAREDTITDTAPS